MAYYTNDELFWLEQERQQRVKKQRDSEGLPHVLPAHSKFVCSHCGAKPHLTQTTCHVWHSFVVYFDCGRVAGVNNYRGQDKKWEEKSCKGD